MDVTHDPEDEDAFEAISAQLVARFERTAGGGERGCLAEQLLQLKQLFATSG